MNKVILLGRMTRDPDMRYSEKGTAVTRFIIAVNRQHKREEADFVYCVCFGKLAESVAQYCKRGRQVLVNGRLEINTTTNKETGERKAFTTVVASHVEFLAVPKAKARSIED